MKGAGGVFAAMCRCAVIMLNAFIDVFAVFAVLAQSIPGLAFAFEAVDFVDAFVGATMCAFQTLVNVHALIIHQC